MSLPDSSTDALSEGDLSHSHLPSSAHASPASSRPDHVTMTMLASGMSPREIRAESRGGIGGGFYGYDDESDLNFFRGRGRRG
jgi:hypothetical protein